MAELTPQERLQPALLDRLADDEPDKFTEAPERRVLSVNQLHDCVMRDLSWLLNTENLSAVHDLTEFPDAAASTVNFGVPTISGQNLSQIDAHRLEARITESIRRFEPRLIDDSIKVLVIIDETQMQPNSLRFKIEANLWAQPLPLHLLVNADIDLETGAINVSSE